MHMNSGDTAWILASSALVLLMTPGLAFFYGGMVRSKSVLNMLMMSTVTIGIVTPLWVLYGFSMSFGNTGNSIIGKMGFGLQGLYGDNAHPVLAVNGAVLTIPVLVFVAFQLMFAIITPALASGAIADRAKFSGWAVWVILWTTICYFPVAHWVFAFGDAAGKGAGFLAHWGVEDFAGGTAVHVNAGAAGLALALVLGKRIGWKRDPMRPHNVPFTLLGAGLLWFGWFGFNAGSALAANELSAVAFINTQTATATAMLGWLVVEKLRDGKPTTLGAASGAVTGLVAITPACAFVTPVGAVILGFLAGALCAYTVGLKWKLGFDDSLDVVGVHLVGGAFGAISLGFLADPQDIAGLKGLFYGGNASLLGKQVVAVLAVGLFSFTVSFVVAKLIDMTMGFRLDEEEEMTGVDQSEHAETGYDLAGVTTGSMHLAGAAAGSNKSEGAQA
jgi:ammonium transporter, Amt family